MKILKILVACFAVLVLSAFFVFELIFSRSVDKSLSAYAEEIIASDSVEPLSGADPDPSIIDYHWDLSGFDQYNLNLLYLQNGSGEYKGVTYSVSDGVITLNGTVSDGISNDWIKFDSFSRPIVSGLDASCSVIFTGAISGSSTRLSLIDQAPTLEKEVSLLQNNNSFITFTTTFDITGIGIVFNSGLTFNNVKIYVMTVLGTYTIPSIQCLLISLI